MHYPTDTLVCMYRQDTAMRQVFVRSAYTYYPDTSEYMVMQFGNWGNDTVKNGWVYDTIQMPFFTRDGHYELRRSVHAVDSAVTIESIFPFPIKRYYDRMKTQDGTYYTGDTSNLTVLDGYSTYESVEGVGHIESYGPFCYPISRRRYFNNISSNNADTLRDMDCMSIKDSIVWLAQYCFEYKWNIAVEEIEIENYPVRVYPNPCLEYLIINFPENTGRLQGSLLTFDGKNVVPPFYWSADKYSLRVIDLPQGIYLLQVLDEKGKMNTYKLIKQ